MAFVFHLRFSTECDFGENVSAVVSPKNAKCADSGFSIRLPMCRLFGLGLTMQDWVNESPRDLFPMENQAEADVACAGGLASLCDVGCRSFGRFGISG